MSWRDGVHLTGTPIWCDARRRRDVCFVSSADRVGRAGHGQLIGTPQTLALIAAPGAGHLGVPVHRPFTLGTLRLELIPSGRGLGAAALVVDSGEHTVLYAGAIRTVNPAGGAEVRACDAVVVMAAMGEPHHRFEPHEVVADRLLVWLRARTGTHVSLVVDNVLDGLELAGWLAGQLAIAGSKTLREAAEVAALPAIRAPGREPVVSIRVDGDRAKAPTGASALVSARAVDPQPGWDAAFAWPFVDGRDQLLAWIEQARATDVFVTGPCAETIAAAVGPKARVLGPPRQMALFGL